MAKSRHNPIPPPWYRPRQPELSAQYQREVDRSTEKLEREFARAEKRVQQAEARLGKAKTDVRVKTKRHVIAELEAALEIRRDELEGYRRMMVAVPASAEHRGTKSYRPVPNPRT